MITIKTVSGQNTGDGQLFREWAMINREHLRNVVFVLAPYKQLEHERQCEICQQGLQAAIRSLTANQIMNAVSESVRVATELAERDAKRMSAASGE